MDLRKVFNWLIALAVAAALIATPLSAPVMAASQMAAAADQMQAMADDMPCCPQHDQKAKDCGSCPLVALCMLSITMPPPDGSGAPVDRTVSLSAFALPDDLLIDGLGEHPPDYPPRTIV